MTCCATCHTIFPSNIFSKECESLSANLDATELPFPASLIIPQQQTILQSTAQFILKEKGSKWKPGTSTSGKIKQTCKLERNNFIRHHQAEQENQKVNLNSNIFTAQDWESSVCFSKLWRKIIHPIPACRSVAQNALHPLHFQSDFLLPRWFSAIISLHSCKVFH